MRWIGNLLLCLFIRSFVMYILLMPSWPEIVSWPQQLLVQLDLADVIGASSTCTRKDDPCPATLPCPELTQQTCAKLFKVSYHTAWANASADAENKACHHGGQHVQQALQQLRQDNVALLNHSKMCCPCLEAEQKKQDTWKAATLAQQPQPLAPQHLEQQSEQHQKKQPDDYAVHDSMAPQYPDQQLEPHLKELPDHQPEDHPSQKLGRSTPLFVTIFVTAAMAVKGVFGMALTH